jgi:putative endonuclease
VHHIYIVRCADGTLYTGYARSPVERQKVHNAGRGAKYTASRRPVTLVYVQRCRSVSAALKREHQIKRWSRAQKEALIASAGPLPARRPSTRRTGRPPSPSP